MGRGVYVDDIALPGMLHAAFVRSPYAHARIISINVREAAAATGVVAVFSGTDLEHHVAPVLTPPNRKETALTKQQPLPSDRVRFAGEAVAVVVATSRYLAEDAAELVEVEWEPQPVVVDGLAAMAEGAPTVDPDLVSNNVAHIVWDTGDVDAAFAAADRTFFTRFLVHRYAAMPLETRGVVATFNPSSDELTVWLSSQFPHITRTALSASLGMSERAVRVVSPAVGGGFGLKVALYPEDVVIPAVSRLLARPVKWIEDRYEHIAASSHSKEVWCEMTVAVSEEGDLLAFRAHYVGSGGGYNLFPFGVLTDPLCAAGMIFNQYKTQHAHCTVDGPLTNQCPIGPYRGVGWTSGHTIREVLIDEVARGLDIDPVELRLKNTIPEEPYRTPFGQQYDGGSYRRSLEAARDLLDYSTFRRTQSEQRLCGRYLGVGFSPYVEPSGWGKRISDANGFTDSNYFDCSRVTIEPDGSATITTGFHSQGQGHETTFAQVGADMLGLRLEDVRVVEGDTETSVFGMGTFASRGAVIGSGAIRRAAHDVREKLVRLAADALEAAPEDIELHDGIASVIGTPSASRTVAELAASVYYGGAQAPADVEDAVLTSTRSYEPGESYSNGVVAAIVEVDVETGIVDVQRVVAVEDCGTMLNPMIVEGQVAGAIAQGIGGALYEEIQYDEHGQLLTSTLMEYLYPSAMDIPSIEIAHIETASPVTDGGVKGLGEGGSIAAPAAVLNAVADALAPFSIRIVRTPLDPDEVLRLLRDAGTKGDDE